jgi:hypothetical protein
MAASCPVFGEISASCIKNPYQIKPSLPSISRDMPNMPAVCNPACMRATKSLVAKSAQALPNSKLKGNKRN